MEKHLSEAGAKQGFKLPPGILDYTFNDNAAVPKSSLVQVGQKWNIEDGFQRANNDNDILDEVAEPLKINTA